MPTSFKPRLTAPSYSDRYWIHTSSGGLNECIRVQGNSCLPNCVGYAWGRAYEIMGRRPNLSKSNAENWYSHNDGYARSQQPKLGAIIVWAKGRAGVSSDGAGHVAVVEEIKPNGDIVTSNSGYMSTRFWTKTHTRSSGYAMSGYTFLGFIHIPNTPDVTGDFLTGDTTGGNYVSGQIYQSEYTREDGIVREFAYLNKKNEVSLNKSKTKVSIINYTALLQDISDAQGLMSGGISGGSSGLIDVSTGGTGAPLKGKSGATLTVKKTISIPENIRSYLHSGDDCTDYSYWSRKLGWTQGKVAKVWRDRGQPHDSRGVGTLDGHLTIAMKGTFGDAGDLVRITCQDGLVFTAVLVDIKGSDATSPYGHQKGNDVSPCEWYVWTPNDSVNDVSSFKGVGDWKGKKVVKVENYGSWLNG